MTKIPLYYFGWLSELGGADTRIVHTLPILAEFCDITLIPNSNNRLEEKKWTAFLDNLNIKYSSLEDLPSKLEGVALSMSNPYFFLEGKDKIAKDKGLYVIFSSEMNTHFPKELDAAKGNTVDHFLYTSEFNKKALERGYSRSSAKKTIVPNYINPDLFPYMGRVERSQSRLKTHIGKLSRSDPSKYPENFPLFYENLPIKNPLFRIMSWEHDIAAKYRWHYFDSRWSMFPDDTLTALEFLNDLDIYVYCVNHTFQESWGRSVVEAMLTGLPVLVPAGHNFENMIKHEETGFICKDYNDYCKYVKELEEPLGRISIGIAARKGAEELCNREVQKSIWMEVLSNAV